MAEERTERGPNIDVDELLQTHAELARGETDAASLSGERRQRQGALADGMVLENKGLSQFRAGLKIKNEGKRRDWVRTMEALLPIAREVVFGNQPDMLTQSNQPDTEPSEPMSEADVDELAGEMDEADANIEHVDFATEIQHG